MGNKIANYIRSYNGGSFLKRLVFLMVALVLMNFGIACYYQCALGTDPFSVFVDGEHSIMGMTYGQVTNINNIFLFTFMLIFARKYIHVGSILGVLFAGTLIDLFNMLISTYFPGDVLWKQVLLLVLGLITFGISVGMFIVANMGVSALEAIPLVIGERTTVNLRWLRVIEDVLFTIIGVILGVIAGRQIFSLNIDPTNPPMIGIGTLVGAFGTGPIMKWFMNAAGEPLEKWFGPLRKTPAPEANTEG